MSRHLLPVALLVLAVLVATWPTGGTLFVTAVGSAYGDMADHYWGTWWFGHELGLGRLPIETDLSHRPDTLALWYVDPVGATLALPLRLLGFPAAWNLLVLLQLTLATIAAYAVGWGATRDRGSALVAAMVAGPSPYALGLVHSGLSEYLGLAPVTLFAWTCLATLCRACAGEDVAGPAPTGWRRWAPAVWLGISGWQAGYYLLFGVLYAAALVPGPGWMARAREGVRVVGVGVLIALPVVGASVLFVGDGGAVTAANAPGWTARLPATDLLTFFRPGAYYFPDTPANGNPGILHVNYLGWTALVLAAWGMLRPNPAGLPVRLRRVFAYSILAMGPRLAIAQKIVLIGTTSVLLPLGLLYFPGSPLGLVHQPYRMVALLLPILAVAAARGAHALPTVVRPLLAAVVLIETLSVSPAPWPIATRTVEAPPVYAALPAGAVLDWPPDASTSNRDYLVWAVSHGRPIAYGVNVFLPESLRRDPLVDRLLRALEHPDDRARNRDVPFAGPLLLRPKGTRTKLRELGFGSVVVHHERLSPREEGRIRNLLVGELGEPIHDDAEASAWAVP